MIIITAAVMAVGCDRRTEDPIAIGRSEAPPVPIIPPGKAGGPSGEGLAVQPGQQGLADAPLPPAIDTTIADIMNRPVLYAGKTVSVVSAVEEIFTPWAFKLNERQAAAGGIDNDMLVLGAIPLTSLGVDVSWIKTKVIVVGTVRVLQAEDFRLEYGRGVDDLLFRRFEGKPAIIARSVKKAP